jgi:hypothetical protein
VRPPDERDARIDPGGREQGLFTGRLAISFISVPGVVEPAEVKEAVGKQERDLHGQIVSELVGVTTGRIDRDRDLPEPVRT